MSPELRIEDEYEFAGLSWGWGATQTDVPENARHGWIWNIQGTVGTSGSRAGGVGVGCERWGGERIRLGQWAADKC